MFWHRSFWGSDHANCNYTFRSRTAKDFIYKLKYRILESNYTMSGKLEMIPIEKLRLDDQNPRLPASIHGKDRGLIIEYMLMEAATLDLMLAIGQNGFFAGEPLLVVADGEAFKVIEGNRRLTALLLLQDPTIATVQTRKTKEVFDAVSYKGEKIAEVPCQVFDEIAPIHKYLGYRHITGIQSWDLTQKAAFLTRIWKQEFPKLVIADASVELAKMIGSRRDYVKRLLIGNLVFEAIRDNSFFKVKGLDESSFYFNYIADSLRYPNICAFLGIEINNQEPTEKLDLEKLDIWTHWFFEKNDQNQPRIRATAKELVMLNAVLENKKATALFRDDKKPLSEAYELTGEIENVFKGAIANAIAALENADSLTHRLDGYYESLPKDLLIIFRLAKKIKKATEEELVDGD